MANLPTRTTKGTPPPAPSQNLTKGDSDRIVGLNFKVPIEFRREFKGYANDHDLSMVELLLRCFEAYKQSQK